MLRVFLLMTHCSIGALPLGILITSDEKQETIERALSMLKDSLGDTAFYSRGLLGPLFLMTDNCDALR